LMENGLKLRLTLRWHFHHSSAVAYNVQRFATRRQHERLSAMHRHTSSTSFTCPRAISAVYSGAREAREGANRIVICRRI
jgi:hypothetical protein